MQEKLHNDKEGVSIEDLTRAFERTQSLRFARVTAIVAGARRGLALSSYENTLRSTLIFNILGPHLGDDYFHSHLFAPVIGAAHLQRLPVPHRPREIPFTDELPARPVGHRITRLVQFIFIGVVLFLTFAIPYRSLYDDSFSYVQRIYFASQLISPVLMYTMDGYREGNQGTLLSTPSIFLAMQIKWLGPMAAIHSILTARYGFELPTGRFIRHEVNTPFLATITLCSMIPMVLLLLNSQTEHISVVLQEYSPVLLLGSIWSASIGLSWWRRHYRVPVVRRAQAQVCSSTKTPAFKYMLGVAGVVQAAAYVSTLLYLHHSGHLRSMYAFSGLGAPLYICMYEFDIAATIWLVSHLYSFWNMRRLGYASTHQTLNAVMGTIGGQLIFGPGATWIGVSYWRDTMLSKLECK